jgi:type I restriction enzyme S subunit
MGNLGRGDMNLRKLEFIQEGESINTNDEMKDGDLFFNTRDTLDLVGKVAIWRSELPKAYYN